MEGDIMLSICRGVICYFNPLPPHGGRLESYHRIVRDIAFQSTPSAWRETSQQMIESELELHFNPLPPHGGRLYNYHYMFSTVLFQSTPSAWRETLHHILHYLPLAFQSTPSAWRETLHLFQFDVYTFISIHSLRMEGDTSYL